MSLLSKIRKAPTAVHPDPAPNTRQIFDNLLVCSDNTVLAGFRMGDVRWDYTGVPAKAQTLEQVQDGWALLQATDFHERVTTRPHPVEQWAQRLDARTPNPLPDVHLCDRGGWSDQELADGRCGCYTWNAHLAAMQRRIASTGQDDKLTFRYFVVGTFTGDLRAEALGMRWHGARPSDEARAIFVRAKQIADAVTGPGWHARRMTEREQEWLRHRSLGIAMPAPRLTSREQAGWSGTDLPALSTDIRWVETVFDRTVRLIGWRDGKQVERVVQVLTVAADPPELHYPENGLEPWQVYAERCVDLDGRPIGSEWSVNGRIASGEELKAQAELDLRKAMHLDNDYRDFKEPPREDIARGIRRAAQVRDEVSNGKDRDAARFVGTVNLVVWGEPAFFEGKQIADAEEVCEQRAEAMKRLYASNDMGFTLVTPHGQAAKLAEFVPGELPVWDRVGYQRQWPLDFHAAGLPHVSTAVGDGHGPYTGPTRGAAKRPTFHDSHYATEGRATGRGQNLWLWVSTLGGGKSVGVSAIIYNAVRRNIRTVVRDPSGPMLGLTLLPEFKPYATGFNLLEGENGILSPPSLIRDPVLEEFDGDEDAFERALVQAQSERNALVRDMARRTLEWDLYDHAGTRSVLREAARRTEWTRERTLWDLVDALRDGDDHARDVADALDEASRMPRSSLLFAPRNAGGDYVRSHLRDNVLTVVATPGVKRAADSTPRAEWNPEELAADALVYGTGLYTGRMVYDKPMSERAVFVADEAEDLTDGSVGRAFLSRLGRDHSKWNLEGHLLLKNLNDAVMSREILNFIAGAWLGRMAKLGPAEDLLEQLGTIDVSYAKSLLRLSERRAGEFVHLDADNRVGGMAIDLAYLPHVQDAIFTTPDPTGMGAWATDEEVLG